MDSADSLEEAVDAARSLAEASRTVVAVTGERDFVTDGRKSYMVSNGHALLGRVTGTGCAATVTIGAFLAAERDPVLASAAALAFFGLAGERAAERANGPGTFWPHLLDALYNISPEDLANRARIERI